MSDFLLNVVRRGAGLPAAVSPRTRPRHEGPPADAEALAVDADAAPDVATDRDEPLPVAEPRMSGAVPEPVLAVRPAPERASITRMMPDRPHDAVIAPPRVSREEPQGDDRSLLRAAPHAGNVSPTVPSAVPPSVEPETTPAVRPATTALWNEAVASPPAAPTVRPTSIDPRLDPVDSVAAPAPGPRSVSTPPPILEPVAEQRAIVADRPADGPMLAPVRLQPATTPAVAWPVAGPAPDAPRVDVRIGRIEILPPPAAAPPPAAPRRQPRGFAAETSARSYRDRRWY